ncbi:hypothetical protein Cgig2_032906 [Carnegiea gigantea]|uniref:Uncharacterized protein n=1 Tax=Carnegiea gigantea TaxID=171969 RepID=A0A9Q1GJX7_9CARY|nr:hypothetical protein Cgig2_032906 [Carnegiea gigantea]
MVNHNEDRFGGILAVKTTLIPKRLARWLPENYDLRDTLLKLANGKVLIYEEDVHATLDLSMGPLEVSEGKNSESDTKSNIERGGPPFGSMDFAIIEGGGYGVEFIINFIIYVISTCIIGNANNTCQFRVLKYLCSVNEIHIKISLFYLDRVEFKADKMKRGRIIERLNYQNVACLADVDLQQYLNELDGWMGEQDQQGLKSDNVHIVHIAKENFKALYLSIMCQRM